MNPDQQHALDMASVTQRTDVNGFQSHAFNQFGNLRLCLGTVADQRNGRRPAEC
jgi:hypothetical protein